MSKLKNLVLFDQREIRRHWDEEKELWWFSVIDVVKVLTDQTKIIKESMTQHRIIKPCLVF